MLADPESWRSLPAPVRDWLEFQQMRSQLPSADEVLIETFPHAKRYFMVATPSRAGSRIRLWECC